MLTTTWWGGGAVERAGLENRYGLRVIVGSNPTPTVSFRSQCSMNDPKPFPEILKQINFVLAGISLLALILGATMGILMIWDNNLANNNWVPALIGNCAVLIGCALVLIVINRICGSMRGAIAKVINALVIIGITACFIISTLVIWGITGSDDAFKAIGTIVVLTVVAFIFVPIANAIHRPKG
jgi:hypothetical protein